VSPGFALETLDRKFVICGIESELSGFGITVGEGGAGVYVAVAGVALEGRGAGVKVADGELVRPGVRVSVGVAVLSTMTMSVALSRAVFVIVAVAGDVLRSLPEIIRQTAIKMQNTIISHKFLFIAIYSIFIVQ
jgi:hypothetical protein